MKKYVPYGIVLVACVAVTAWLFLLSQISDYQNQSSQFVASLRMSGLALYQGPGRVAGARTYASRFSNSFQNHNRGTAVAPSPSPTPTPKSSPTPSPKTTPTPPAAGGTSPTPTAAPSPTPTPVAVQTQWGAYVGDDPGDLESFEGLVGQPVNIQAEFVGFGDAFPFALAANLKPAGKTLVIFWEPYNYTYAQMTNGSEDSYMQSFAAQIKSYGGPVILAPFEEMNGNWDPWDGPLNGNSPAGFIALWQYVHKFFGGVSNVKFAWDVNNESEPDTSANSIAAYYPGSQYVDYVGVDGFNFNDPWQTWAEVFPPSLMQQLAAYGKPVYILSTASADGPQKAQWITDMAAGVKQYGLAGWVWFNQDKEQNWLVNSDQAALSAFQAAIP